MNDPEVTLVDGKAVRLGSAAGPQGDERPTYLVLARMPEADGSWSWVIFGHLGELEEGGLVFPANDYTDSASVWADDINPDSDLGRLGLVFKNNVGQIEPCLTGGAG